MKKDKIKLQKRSAARISFRIFQDPSTKLFSFLIRGIVRNNNEDGGGEEKEKCKRGSVFIVFRVAGKHRSSYFLLHPFRFDTAQSERGIHPPPTPPPTPFAVYFILI